MDWRSKLKEALEEKNARENTLTLSAKEGRKTPTIRIVSVPKPPDASPDKPDKSPELKCHHGTPGGCWLCHKQGRKPTLGSDVWEIRGVLAIAREAI
jgi:hypothetical protein